MKKLLAIFLSILLLCACIPLGAIPVSAATSGTIGDCQWALSGNTLFITGEGAMQDYKSETEAPWYSLRESIVSVFIGDGVTTIAAYAFHQYTSMTSVTIPDGITVIGDYAFYNCFSLTSVTIPASVTAIGKAAFHSCSRLKKVYITDLAAWCAIDFYVNPYVDHYSYFHSNPLYYASLYVDNVLVRDLVIPDGVTAIGNGAFYGCSSLTSVTIPDSVTTLGAYAFYSCGSFESVTIGNNVTTIDRSTFQNCDSLTEVIIPDSVTTIGAHAFYDCDSLTEVTIGDSVTTIGGNAFYECTSLKSVYITDLAAWCAIYFNGVYANPFWCANSLYVNDVLTRDVVIPDGAAIINDLAFYDCDFIDSVTIPNSVTAIGNYAFYDCDNMLSITIPDSVTTIGNQAFYECGPLTWLTLGYGVTSIGEKAFERVQFVTYRGTVEDRIAIQFHSDNSCLFNAAWTYHTHVYDNKCDSVCNDCLRTRTVNHTYDDVCDADCNVCGEVREVVAHVYTEETLNPDCCNEGKLIYTCTNCGYSYEEVLPALGHTFDAVVTAPDCVTGGYTTYVCTVCGESYVTDETAALGHTYDAICDADCNVCGEVRGVEVPADAPTFAVDMVTATAGETVTVAIRTRNNPGIVSLKLRVAYDATVLELVSIEEADFADAFFSPLTNNPFIVTWTDAIHPDNTTNGVVALITFRVKEDAAAGTTAVTVTYDPEDVYDQSFDNVAFYVENGGVEIVEYTPGDVNEDGKINNKDLGILQQYLAEWGVTVNLSAADTNADGRINNKDLGLLQQYLAEWGVTLG